MELTPKVGRPSLLTEEEAERILSFVSRGLVMGQVARLAMVPRTTLERFLKRGCDEASKNVDANYSIYAQFWLRFEHIRGNRINDLLVNVENAGNNWQAPWKLLGKVAKDDFGDDTADQKELLERIEKVHENISRLQLNRTAQGVQDNDELDSGSD